MQHDPSQSAESSSPQLIRGISLGSATALNMIDMIGVGPFITIPLIVSAMGGPQAMLGWILGALFAICDGLVWAELGAALPGSGGSYRYLREIYGPNRLGRLVSFLFIWQLSFSAPLSIASGSIGLAGYASYFWPAIGWIIFAGLTHFNAARVFSFPPGAFALSHDFFLGLGSAMLIATYDYWGYYNISFLGDEVKEPSKTIPRALLLSILLVACLYVVMNVSILAVVPWWDLIRPAQSNSGLFVVSIFMQRIYGVWAANLVTALVMWTAFASVFSLMLGYSRVPYAAALDGNYFRAFARVHPQHRFPYVSLLALGGVALLFCFFSLADVIAALVVIRILLQFLVQAIGVIVLRIRRPDLPRPFRMWFYPLPALIASFGFVFILISRKNFLREIRYAAVILIAGLLIYFIRAWRNRDWPFGQTLPAAVSEVPTN